MDIREAFAIAFPANENCPCCWVQEEVNRRQCRDIDGDMVWSGPLALRGFTQLSLLTEVPVRELVRRVEYHLGNYRIGGKLKIVNGFVTWEDQWGAKCVDRATVEQAFATPVP